MSVSTRIAKLERQTNVHGEPFAVVFNRFDGTPPHVELFHAEHLTPKARHRLRTQALRWAERQAALGNATVLSPEPMPRKTQS